MNWRRGSFSCSRFGFAATHSTGRFMKASNRTTGPPYHPRFKRSCTLARRPLQPSPSSRLPRHTTHPHFMKRESEIDVPCGHAR